MASYRYERDIDPADLAPRAEKQYTRKERWANWWDYNLKWVLLIGIAAAFVAYSFIGQYFFTTKPDYNVAAVATYYMPDDTVTALQEQLARYGEDLNGDGKTVVTLNGYTLDYSAGDTQTESDAYLTMAGTTKLATDVAGGLSSVILLYDPAGFQESTGSLRYLDGTLPAPVLLDDEDSVAVAKTQTASPSGQCMLLALGADGVLICRPFGTAVYGGGEEGGKCYIDKLAGELADTMQLCGAPSIEEITPDMVRV